MVFVIDEHHACLLPVAYPIVLAAGWAGRGDRVQLEPGGIQVARASTPVCSITSSYK